MNEDSHLIQTPGKQPEKPPSKTKKVISWVRSWLWENGFKILQGTGAIALIFGVSLAGLNRIWTTREIAYIDYNQVPFFVAPAVVPFRNPEQCISMVDAWAQDQKAQISNHAASAMERVILFNGHWLQVTCIWGLQHSFAIVVSIAGDAVGLNNARTDLQRSIETKDKSADFLNKATQEWQPPNIASVVYTATLTMSEADSKRSELYGSLPESVIDYFVGRGFPLKQCSRDTCSFFKPGFSLLLSAKRIGDKKSLRFNVFVAATAGALAKPLGLNSEETYSLLIGTPGLTDVAYIGQDDPRL